MDEKMKGINLILNGRTVLDTTKGRFVKGPNGWETMEGTVIGPALQKEADKLKSQLDYEPPGVS